MNFRIIFILTIFIFSNYALQAQMDKVKVYVEGLGCPFCAYGLEKKFKELKKIKKIKIDMESGIFTYEAPADMAMSIEAIDDRVTKAGYTAVDISIQRHDGAIEKSGMINQLADKTKIKADKKEAFEVWGKCVMCKKRIEKAALSLSGVKSANWNLDSHLLAVSFDSQQNSIKDVIQKVVEVGHDTKDIKASQETYNNLPACCLYKRN